MAPQQKVHQYLLLSFEDLIYTKLYLSYDNTKSNNLILQSSKRNFTSSIDTGVKNTKTLKIKNELRVHIAKVVMSTLDFDWVNR